MQIFNTFFMELELTLLKMPTRLLLTVKYGIYTKEGIFELNPLIGKSIQLHFDGRINCIVCGKVTKKSFGQGFCYNCFISAPEAEACVLHPEQCKAHLGIARDMQWAQEHCLQPHFVYLSQTSNIKVGVTRASQIPTRWIDQGAVAAIIIAKTPYRQLAGEIEVLLKNYFSDKTLWQQMLKATLPDETTLLESKEKAITLLSKAFQDHIVDEVITKISYPVNFYPSKIKSIDLDKTPDYKGVLTGIKGQYLIFEDGYVINIRKYSGYHVYFNFQP